MTITILSRRQIRDILFKRRNQKKKSETDRVRNALSNLFFQL